MLSLVPCLGWVNQFLLIHVYIFNFYSFKCDLYQAIHYQAEKKKIKGKETGRKYPVQIIKLKELKEYFDIWGKYVYGGELANLANLLEFR